LQRPKHVEDVGMSFLLLYVLLGLLFLLFDFAHDVRKGNPLEDQLKAMFFLSEDDPITVTISLLCFVLAWPIIMVMLSGGPPTRGAM
jgi:hypothetical protein